MNQIPALVWGGEVATKNGKVIAMQFFQTVYAIDTGNSGELLQVAQERGAKVIGPDITKLPDIIIKGGFRPEAPPAA